VPAVHGQRAERAGERLVERELLRSRLDEQRAGETRRQPDARQRPGVAHHDLRQQPPQLDAAGLRELPAAVREAPHELRAPAEVTGPEQAHQIVQLLHAVLDGGGGEQQQEARRQPLDEGVGLGAVVLQGVGLVDDHEVPGPREDRVAVPVRTRRRERGHDDAIAVPRRGGLRAARLDGELAGELLAPLPDERGRCQDERPADASAQQVLGEDEARLDRLAEPDLVGSSLRPRKSVSTLRTASWCEMQIQPPARARAGGRKIGGGEGGG
jgi:hypothetical protein